MTTNINAAIAELQQLQSEFDCCRQYLIEANEEEEDFVLEPGWTEFEKKRLLMRMSALLVAIQYLEKHIKADLSALSIDLFPFNKTAHDEV